MSVRCREWGAGTEFVSGEKPDIVITDILMPVMNGLEMARKILSIDISAQIIVITAYSDMDGFIDSERLFVHRVWKPVDIDELYEAVSHCRERIAAEGNAGSTGRADSETGLLKQN